MLELEIEARAGGLDVGEARGWASLVLGGGSGFDVGGVEEDALEVPLAVGEWTRLTLGSVKLMVENSTRLRQRELMRRVA